MQKRLSWPFTLLFLLSPMRFCVEHSAITATLLGEKKITFIGTETGAVLLWVLRKRTGSETFHLLWYCGFKKQTTVWGHTLTLFCIFSHSTPHQSKEEGCYIIVFFFLKMWDHLIYYGTLWVMCLRGLCEPDNSI